MGVIRGGYEVTCGDMEFQQSFRQGRLSKFPCLVFLSLLIDGTVGVVPVCTLIQVSGEGSCVQCVLKRCYDLRRRGMGLV